MCREIRPSLYLYRGFAGSESDAFHGLQYVVLVGGALDCCLSFVQRHLNLLYALQG